MRTINRRDFMLGSVAFVMSPLFAVDGRLLKTPLMLDTKRVKGPDGKARFLYEVVKK